MNWANMICSNCAKVSRIEFLWGAYPPRAVAHVLEQMGGRLRQVRLWKFGLHIEPVLKVAQYAMSTCPNAAFEIWIDFENMGSLAAFGKRIRALRITGRMGLSEGPVAIPLENLEDLYIEPSEVVTAQYMSVVFSTPMPRLLQAHLDCLFESVGDLHKLLGLISTVEVLSCNFFAYSCDYVPTLVSRNRNLKSVTIVYTLFPGVDDDPVAAEDWVCALLRYFVQFTSLQELVIMHGNLTQKSDKIATACTLFRGRSTDVFIECLQYN